MYSDEQTEWIWNDAVILLLTMWLMSANGHYVTKRAIIDVNSIVSEQHCDILT